MPTVIVVGSTLDARKVADGLRAAGFTVVAVPDGPAATEALAADAARLLVIDLTMPLLDRQLLTTALAPALPAQPESLADAERRHIAIMLAHTHGNRRDAAHLLGIARSTLLAKLRRYGLDHPS